MNKQLQKADSVTSVDSSSSWNDNPDITKIWELDLKAELGRMSSAERLTKIISNYNKAKVSDEEDDSLTLVIKSPWGTGKTYFAKKWMETLQQRDCFCVYFSAWEAEMYDNPAQYFLETFLEAFAKEPRVNSKTAEWIHGFFMRFMRFNLLISKIIKLPDKAPDWLPIPFLSLEALKNEGHDIVKQWLDEVEKAGKPPASLPKAKEFLEGIVEELEQIFTSKIYVFIDELDRCKPTFSISLIETIKHFFAVKGLIFTLSVDLDQLEGSIKHVYGKHIDCEAYLMRFVQLFFSLPPIGHVQYSNYLSQQISEMPDTLKTLTNEHFTADSFASVFALLSQTFDASLRDQQMIIRRLKLMLTAGKVFLFPTVYFLFVQLRYPTLWQRAVYGELNTIAPNRIESSIIKHKKELIGDFSGENPAEMRVQIVKHLEMRLLDEQISLLNETILLMKLSDNPARQKRLGEIDGECHSKDYGKHKQLPFWQRVQNNYEEFFKQIDLINLYSDSFN